MRTKAIFTAATTALAVLSAPAITAQASEADVANFYRGKTLTMYIGFSAGGGYDAYARLIMRHMLRFVPGNPRGVAKQYTGAGGVRVLNAVYNVFPQDGTALVAAGRSIITQPLFRNAANAKYDGSKLKWLGSANQEYSVCVFHKTSKYKSTEDLLQGKPNLGGVGIGSSIDVFTLLVNNLLGAKIKLITGYPGGADINLAMQRNELDGRCGWSWSSIQTTASDWIRDNKINITLQHALTKHPDLQQIPLITDLVKSKKDKQALKVHLAPQAYGRPFAVGPKVPQERYEALRTAFWKTMHDPKFLADTKKRKMPIDALSGQDVQKLIAEIYALPKDVLAYADKVGNSRETTEVATAVIPIETYKGAITKLKAGGRRVSWKGAGASGKLRVSGSKTKITVAGKKAKRKALKIGMKCSFRVKGAQTALNIDCP
jgi:tripartite-type tricarboxylate transporter receptor subunit TctC